MSTTFLYPGLIAIYFLNYGVPQQPGLGQASSLSGKNLALIDTDSYVFKNI